MSGGRATYEVQLLRDDHWVAHQLHEQEEAARAQAQALFSNKQIAGVRVVRDWQRADGSVSEQVVSTQTREPEAKPIRIIAVDEAPLCRARQDYYGPDSRLTISRMLRRYLDDVMLTPTELLHNYRQLKRVMDTDTIYPAAIDRVATLQAKAAGEDARGRRDQLFKSMDQIADRARRAEKMALPSLKTGDFNAALARIVHSVTLTGEHAFYGLVVLSNDLVNLRTWLGKLERLLALATDGIDAEALALIDGVVADLMAVPTIMEDLMGYQPSLAQSLCRQLDLVDGRFPCEIRAPTDPVRVLNRMLAAGRLPAARAALFERIMRSLRSGAPLNKTDPAGEAESLRQVAVRLSAEDGLVGGPAAAEALTQRALRLREQGGKAGRQAAIYDLVMQLPETRARIHYLLALAAAPASADDTEEIVGHLRGVLHGRDLNSIAPRTLSVRDRMAYCTSVHAAIQGSALPDEHRRALCESIDDRLARFLVEEGLIEKLDDQKRSLRERAQLLVQFCGAKVLPDPGKAIEMARNRVLAHLRMANFDTHFVEDLPTVEEKQKALRQLNEMLLKAGFG